MKKILVLLFFLGIAAAYLISPVIAAESDQFYITVTISNIDITLRNQGGSAYGTWALGVLSTSTVSTMAANSWGGSDQGVQVDNNSNVTIDLECAASNDGSWTYNTSNTTPGSDICVLRAKNYDTAPASADMSTGAVFIGATATDVVTSVPATTDRYFYYEHTTPSATSTYSLVTHTVTVTGTLP